MHPNSIITHRMFVAALTPGVSETAKLQPPARETEREESVGEKTTKAARRLLELTARPLRDWNREF